MQEVNLLLDVVVGVPKRFDNDLTGEDSFAFREGGVVQVERIEIGSVCRNDDDDDGGGLMAASSGN